MPNNGTSEQQPSRMQQMGMQAKQACAWLKPQQSQQLWETIQRSMAAQRTDSSHARPSAGHHLSTGSQQDCHVSRAATCSCRLGAGCHMQNSPNVSSAAMLPHLMIICQVVAALLGSESYWLASWCFQFILRPAGHLVCQACRWQCGSSVWLHMVQPHCMAVAGGAVPSSGGWDLPLLSESGTSGQNGSTRQDAQSHQGGRQSPKHCDSFLQCRCQQA